MEEERSLRLSMGGASSSSCACAPLDGPNMLSIPKWAWSSPLRGILALEGIIGRVSESLPSGGEEEVDEESIYPLRYDVEAFMVVEDVDWLRGVDVDMPATLKESGWWCACDAYIVVVVVDGGGQRSKAAYSQKSRVCSFGSYFPTVGLRHRDSASTTRIARMYIFTLSN